MKMFAFISAVLFCLSVNLYAAAYSGGSGTAENPYQIADANDLLELAGDTGNYDKCIILTADIDLDPNLPGGQVFTTAIIAPDTSTTSGFQGTQFTGTFDGNGHVISNLTITTSTQSYVGLFGYVGWDGQIRNLGVENVNITGRSYVGGLVGRNYGTLTSCNATGSVSGDYEVGGLAGDNYRGSITTCYATGSVSGDYDVGGLVGRNSSGTLTACYVTGSVSGDYSVGGLVGYNDYGTLTACYATGSVSGINVGGLVGHNYSGSLSFCYATGSVSGSYDVGGLVGWNYGMLSSCYATGLVSGDYHVGGLVGDNYSGSITACFWDIQTSGTSDGVGNVDPNPAGVIGKMTEEMQVIDTFLGAGWDFTNETTNGTSDIWRMCVDGVDYPRLNWQSTDGDFACPNGVGVEDLNYFVGRWLLTDCTVDNDYCDGVDMDSSGTVNLTDLAEFAQHWLEGT